MKLFFKIFPQHFLILLTLMQVTFKVVYAAETRLTWNGHAAFQIITPLGKVLMIDPWLTNPLNPTAKDGKNPVEAIEKVDYILLTHGHSDHIGEAIEIGKKTGAKLVANFELGNNLVARGYPKEQAGLDTLMNIGGEIQVANGEVTLAMTPAVHSSGMDSPEPNHPMIYGGNPAGFVVKIKAGPTFYHTGDTAYFSDMDWIGKTYAPDVALINIGGHFGMTPEMAIQAARSVKAKTVIPQHYKTFPILTQDPRPFTLGLKKIGIASRTLEPGDTLVFEGKKIKK